jgi:hypothetical protein
LTTVEDADLEGFKGAPKGFIRSTDHFWSAWERFVLKIGADLMDDEGR